MQGSPGKTNRIRSPKGIHCGYRTRTFSWKKVHNCVLQFGNLIQWHQSKNLFYMSVSRDLTVHQNMLCSCVFPPPKCSRSLSFCQGLVIFVIPRALSYQWIWYLPTEHHLIAVITQSQLCTDNCSWWCLPDAKEEKWDPFTPETETDFSRVHGIQ